MQFNIPITVKLTWALWFRLQAVSDTAAEVVRLDWLWQLDFADDTVLVQPAAAEARVGGGAGAAAERAIQLLWIQCTNIDIHGNY